MHCCQREQPPVKILVWNPLIVFNIVSCSFFAWKKHLGLAYVFTERLAESLWLCYLHLLIYGCFYTN